MEGLGKRWGGEQEEGSCGGRYSNEGKRVGAGRKKETELRRTRQIKGKSAFETRMVGLCRLEYEEGRKGREEEGV